MKHYLAVFEHVRWCIVRQGYAPARNPEAALVRCAQAAGLKARRKNGVWSFLAATPAHEIHTGTHIYQIRTSPHAIA